MFLKHVKYYFLLLASLMTYVAVHAQLGGLGGPVLNITFGEAPTDNLAIPGPKLALGFTAFSYTSNICPEPGNYTVVSGITNTCNNSSWIPLFNDNTPYPDDNGYMMLIHDTASSNPRIIFSDALPAPCAHVNYQFSAAIINIDKPSYGCIRFSSITLQVEDTHGNILGSTNTGDIQFAVYSMGYHFTKYVVDFTPPDGTEGLVVKIIDNAKSVATNCTNDFAVDDIKLAVTGPQVSIAFDGALTGDWVKSTCFQNGESFTMSGNVDPGFSNPAVQWQQSTDDGNTWTDIPGATGYTYTQKFIVADTFLFRLRSSEASIISEADCGVSSNLLKVQVDGIPANFTVSSNSPVCAGSDLIFNATGGASYQWSGPNGYYDNVSYSHIYHSVLADSGIYYVDIKTVGGCHAQGSTDVKIIGTDISAGNDTAICKGSSVKLNANGGGGTYVWSPAAGLSQTTIANPVATPSASTVYTVKIKASDGCAGTAQIKINVLNNVVVKAMIEALSNICSPFDSLSFTDMSTGNINTWHWNFGNGSTSTVQNPGVQFYSSGNNETGFSVQLAVKDTAGCTDTAYHILKVVNNCFIAVPSAFTPNGDGNNDYLYPLNAYKATNLLFRIYNRNGQLVFQTNDWTRKWDGTISGHPQQAGAYVWMLDYTDASGKKISLKGTSILIR